MLLYSSTVRVCLPRYLFVSRRVISWLICSIVTIWLVIHLLIIIVKTVSLTHLRDTESTVSSTSFRRQNTRSKNTFGTILVVIVCRCIDFIALFVLCVCFYIVCSAASA